MPLDNPYVAALRAIDAAEAEVNDGFEADFLADNLARIAQYGEETRFSDKQQAVIRRLTACYLGQEREAELAGQQRLEGM
jgi:hypothetical protein